MFVWSWWVIAPLIVYVLMALLIATERSKVGASIFAGVVILALNGIAYAAGAGNYWDNYFVPDTQIAQEQFGFQENVAYPMTLGTIKTTIVVNGKPWDITTPQDPVISVVESTTQPPSITFDLRINKDNWNSDGQNQNNNSYFEGQHQVRHDMLNCHPVVRNLTLGKKCIDTVSESRWNGNNPPGGLSGWIDYNLANNKTMHVTMVMTPEMHDKMRGTIR